MPSEDYAAAGLSGEQVMDFAAKIGVWPSQARDLLAAAAPLIAARVREQVAAATLRWTATYHGGTALHVLAEQVADGDPRTADLMRYVQRATTEGADHA